MTPILLALAGLLGSLLTPTPTSPDLLRLVDPFVGTAGEGYTFPGPVVPHGMIQWGPETLPNGAKHGGGYDHDDKRIGGFGLTRFSGAGCAGPGDVPFLPTTKAITESPVAPGSITYDEDLLPAFDHRHEHAAPGHYRVARSALRAPRTFPEFFEPKLGNRAGRVRIDPHRRRIEGVSTSARTCVLSPTGHRLYWVAEFDRPFETYGTWTRQRFDTGSTRAADRLDADGPAQVGAYLEFNGARDVEVRVGISYVDPAGARANLRREAGRERTFEAIRAGAGRAWDRILRTVEIEGGSTRDRTMFYSMLYKASIHPSTFGDVDGRYRGMDFRIHRARGYTPYTNFSGWDVYRSQLPLLALLEPDVASDFATSLVVGARESGWLPKWSTANVHTGVMTGDSADPALASIHALGGRGFDARAALAAMVKGATRSGTSPNGDYVQREGVEAHQRLGYIPHEIAGSPYDLFQNHRTKVWGSASTTLEYATDDFAIAMLAASVGESGTCRRFLRRGGWWRNVVDPSTGTASPRSADGGFVSAEPPPGSDPLTTPVAFAQGDAETYTFQVPQDPAGLAAMLGGRAGLERRLDAYFAKQRPGEAPVWLANQPASNSPWLYDWLGRPDKTQRIVRRAITETLTPTPGGLPGNDDLGHLASWYVFGALGFDPTVPGTDVLALGSPLFPAATIHLRRGDVRIVAPEAARDTPYVQGLSLNGAPHDRTWLRLSDLAGGGTLAFDLAAAPDPTWGSDPDAAPPSYGPGDSSTCHRKDQ